MKEFNINIIIIDNKQKIDKKSEIFKKNKKVITFTEKELSNSHKNNIEVIESEINLEKLLASEEVWVSSSNKQVQPVSKINEYILPIKEPKDSMWYKVLEFFQN